MKKIQKDILLLLGILLAAFGLWLIPVLLNKDVPAMVSVLQDGRTLGLYPLTEDRTVSIPYGEEHYNLLLISGGKAVVSDADCPDRLCVSQRAISRKGESIICLPHRLVIQIESKEESDLDAVTY